jgi:hypothetical protein
MSENEKVRVLAVIRKHMDKAGEELANVNANMGFWTEDTTEYMTQAAALILFNQSESCAELEANTPRKKG